MAVEDGESDLPRSIRLKDTFQVAVAKHFTIGDTMEKIMRSPRERVGVAVGDFFTSAVAYMANRGQDAYMQEVGTTTWWGVNQRRILPALVEDPRAAAIQLGIPREIVSRTPFTPGEPYVLFEAAKQGVVINEIAYVLMTADFLVKAQKEPIEALATMTWLCSQMRDMENGRLTIDPQNLSSRAQATEAHFLIHALKEDPKLELGQAYLNMVKKFPQGINSLPSNMMYKGKVNPPRGNSNNN